ncbi:MAG TPA: C10 family peptidase [Bacteroidales bacterium]|nr:C10 family peptidase [Bacteroidales bacterium]
MKYFQICVFFLLTFLFIQTVARADKVGSKTAEELASNFYFEKCLQAGYDLKQDAELSLSYTRITGGEEIFYVFSADDGYIIVAADDDVYPVLAYSFERGYPQKTMSPEFKFWMDSYEKQIVYVRINSIKADALIAGTWDYYLNHFSSKDFVKGNQKSVEPLLMSNWDQGMFYNCLCPEDPAGPDGHVWSGCVATSMAQVMYYYRYPQQGAGSHGYYSDYGYLTANFGATTYRWESMQNDISSKYNYDMALLQLHCGIAIEMNYSPDGSGASMHDDVNAMKSNFGYSNSTNLRYKNDYSNTEWNNMLKSNLDNKMPIQYAGYGETGGHAFVCDGYQGTSFFHFNWGWGGSYNGYFYLDNLNPGYTFNNGQQAIFDSYPSGAFPQHCTGFKTINSLYGTIEDGSSPLYNYQNSTDCMWLISPNDSVDYIRITFDKINTENAYDIITIYDGTTTADSVLGSFSGNTIPPVINSTGKNVLVRFTTNGTNVAEGWQLTFSAEETRFCNSMTEFTTPSGSFSDGSGSYEYNNSTFCRWRINPPGATSITLHFDNFELAQDEDFVRIFDEVANTEITTLYGSSVPQTLAVYSSSVLLLFRTSGVYNGNGWDISYTSAPLSVSQIQKGNVSIAPNPSRDHFSIKASTPRANSLNLDIYNSSGTLVLSRQLITENDFLNETIDVSNFVNGMYFLKLSSENFNHIQKLIVY